MRIRNWKKFQHYSQRRPPWIKLYREILDDAQWHGLSGEAAKGLIMLWLIASEDDGLLPDAKTLAFRLRISENRVTALLSECSHWIEHDDGGMLAPRTQSATPETEKEKRRKEEKEERQSGFQPPSQTEVCQYMRLRGIPEAEGQAELFIAHHANRKWRLGGGKGPVMVDWRKAVVTWQANISKFDGGRNGTRQAVTGGVTRAEQRITEAQRQSERVLGRTSGLVGSLRADLPGRSDSGTPCFLPGNSEAVVIETTNIARGPADSGPPITRIPAKAGASVRDSGDDPAEASRKPSEVA